MTNDSLAQLPGVESSIRSQILGNVWSGSDSSVEVNKQWILLDSLWSVFNTEISHLKQAQVSKR
jgi:hypothetical protein